MNTTQKQPQDIDIGDLLHMAMEDAINAACRRIQEVLCVSDGGLAGVYFSGSSHEHFWQTLVDYAKHELQCAVEDQGNARAEDGEPGMSEWGSMLQKHATSHYAFGWDAIIEALSPADLEDFATKHRNSGGTRENLIAAAAAHFRVPNVTVLPGQWAVITGDIDGTAVTVKESEEEARALFQDMIGRSEPEVSEQETTGVSDFGTTVRLRQMPMEMTESTLATDAKPLNVAVLGYMRGKPSFLMLTVHATAAQSASGAHYEMAKAQCMEHGLQGPMVAFDAHDPAHKQIPALGLFMECNSHAG